MITLIRLLATLRSKVSWALLILLGFSLAGCTQTTFQRVPVTPWPTSAQSAVPGFDNTNENHLLTPVPSVPMNIPVETEPGNIKALPEVRYISLPAMWEYLEQNVGIAGFGGKIFCAFETLKSQEGADGQVEQYLWVLCQEYYQANGVLTKGSGISLPAAIYLLQKGENYQITSHSLPEDGENYAKSIQSVFPEDLWPWILPTDQQGIRAHNQRIARLEAELDRRASAYFKASP